jgi:hypothetical protein
LFTSEFHKTQPIQPLAVYTALTIRPPHAVYTALTILPLAVYTALTIRPPHAVYTALTILPLAVYTALTIRPLHAVYTALTILPHAVYTCVNYYRTQDTFLYNCLKQLLSQPGTTASTYCTTVQQLQHQPIVQQYNNYSINPVRQSQQLQI